MINHPVGTMSKFPSCKILNPQGAIFLRLMHHTTITNNSTTTIPASLSSWNCNTTTFPTMHSSNFRNSKAPKLLNHHAQLSLMAMKATTTTMEAPCNSHHSLRKNSYNIAIINKVTILSMVAMIMQLTRSQIGVCLTSLLLLSSVTTTKMFPRKPVIPMHLSSMWLNKFLWLQMDPKRSKFLRSMLQRLPPVTRLTCGSEFLYIYIYIQ